MKVPVLSSLILLSGLAAPLFAIERPKALDHDEPDERPEAAEGVEDQLREDEPAGEAEDEALPGAQAQPGPWLGVLSEPIDETLSVHLDIAVGVVLSFVAEDSPAAAAGLECHDVIVRVDGRAIANQDELRDEIQAHEPGDEITITVIHRGREEDRVVKLGERPAAVPDRAGLRRGPGALFNLEDLGERLPPDLRDRMKGFEKLLPDGGAQFQRQLDEHMKRLEEQLRELEKQGGGQLKMDFDLFENFDNFPKPGKGNKALDLEFKSSSTFKFIDDEGSVEMKMKDGSKEVVVRDKSGEVLFEGPWDTPQDKASAPAEIRDRIERVNNGNRFRFRLENLPEPQMELPDVEKPELE